MALLTPFQKLLGFEIHGKIGKPGDPDPLDVAGIYRRRPGPNGITIVRMDFYEPTGEPTQEQLDWRAVFADAVLEWQGLSEEEKEGWNKKAERLEMYGYNLCLKEYLLAH